MEIQVMKNILGENDKIASENQTLFATNKVFVLNLMGSPGSGKTSLLEATLGRLKNKLNLAVIEGDLFTSKDAERIEKQDVPVVQINTAGGCHLDAPMVKEALSTLNLKVLDLIIVENVGNLVCPAEFNVGEDVKVVVLSITEGADKPLKYPLIFKDSSVAILNKIDLLPYCNFDLKAAKKDIKALNPQIEIIEASCTKGDGLDDWCNWLLNEVNKKKNE